MRWPAEAVPGRTSHCARLHDWLTQQDTLPEAYRGPAAEGSETVDPAADRWTAYQRLCESHASKLRRARRPLFWIDSADVASTRAVVELAKHCSGTVHVAESPGARNIAAITSTSGWLGTTLAEVHQRGETIVHIGSTHLQEMPRLVERFMTQCPGSPNHRRKHIFLEHSDAAVNGLAANNITASDCLELGVPRAVWLDWLTIVLRRLRDPHAAACLLPPACNEAKLTDFLNYLNAGEYIVLVWGEDEFSDELDRLIVQRLLELAQLLSQTRRCSLLPLSSDPGRITSRETLLWLTNIATTATYSAAQPASPCWSKTQLGTSHSLSDWESEFDWILCLRTLPSDRPLPDIQFDLTLDAASNCSRGALALPEASQCLPVASLGVDGAGHAMRVDHGLVARLSAASVPGLWPSAASVLGELVRQVKTGAAQ